MATSEPRGRRRAPSTVRRLLALDPGSTRPVRTAAALTGAAGLLRLVQLVALAHVVDDLVRLVRARPGGSPEPGGLSPGLEQDLLLTAAALVLGIISTTLVRARSARAAGGAEQRLARRVVTVAAQRGAAADDRVVALLTGGLDRLGPVLTEQCPALVRACVAPAAAAVVLLVLDWRSAVAGLALLPLVPLLGAVVGITTAARVQRSWQEVSRLGAYFLDSVAGLVALRLSDRTDARAADIARSSEEHRRLSLGVLRTAFLSSAATGLVSTLGVGLVAVLCGTRVVSGALDLRTALVAVLLTPELYRAVVDLGGRFHLDAESRAVLDDLESVLRAAGAVPVAPRTPAPTTALREVTATYPDRATPAIADMTWTFAPGRVNAVAGPSGAGKSTLLRVLAGTLHPSTGQVQLSGAVGHLPQHPRFPTARTIGDAVRAGRDGVRDEQVRSALHLACAESLLEPNGGLGRHLAGAGEALSAGERQRLGLARAYCAASAAGSGAGAVLVLDEPTAHLDPDTERRVLDHLIEHAHRRGTTVVMAAHRPAALDAADAVLTLPGLAPAPERARSAAIPPVATALAAGARPETAPATGHPAPAGVEHRWRTGAVAVLGVLAGASSSLSGLALTAVASALLVLASAHPPLLALSLPVVAVRFLALARPLLRYVERLLVHDSAFRELTALRVGTWQRLVPRVPGLGVPARGDLLTRVARDVDDQVEGTVRGRSAAIVLAVTSAVVVVVLATASGLLALVVLGVLAAALACAAGVDVLVGAPALRSLQRRRGQRAEAVVDVIAALDDVVGNAGPTAPAALVAPAIASASSAATRTATAEALCDGAVAVLAALLPVAAAWAIASGAAGAPSAVLSAALVLGMVPLAEEVGALPAAVRSLRLRREASGRIAAVTGARPASTDAAPDAGDLPAARGRGGRPDLALEGVAAAWDPVTRAALVDATLDLPAGSRVAITGASGSGKSTLAAVALHLLDPTAGTVRLAGTDYRAVPGATVRRRVGAVGVADHVFADTVRANTALGRPDATAQEVLDALDRVHLLPWLASLPEGLDTVLGAGGSTVSGGEALRLCTARALLAEPDVLVLDEPVEGLDAQTARAVLRDLDGHGRARSWLLLTHRREGLDLVDDVRVLRDGRLHPTAPPPPEDPDPLRRRPRCDPART